jgi:hypothetical protein
MSLSTIYCIAMEMQHCVPFISVVEIKIFFNVYDWWTVLTAWYYLALLWLFSITNKGKCITFLSIFNHILCSVTEFYRSLQCRIRPVGVEFTLTDWGTDRCDIANKWFLKYSDVSRILSIGFHANQYGGNSFVHEDRQIDVMKLMVTSYD